MEEAPVTAATGALGPVVAKLSALVRRHGEYKLRRRTRKDVKLIRSKLKPIHSILWAIWETEDLILDAAGKELRMEAWRLADDMNDAIDDFILTMIKRGNDGKRFIQAKNQQPRPFQDLKTWAVDVYERCRDKWIKFETSNNTIFCNLFSTTKSTTVESGNKQPRPRVVDPYVHKDISELVGMEEPRKKLIDHLVGEEENTPQLKMACIAGAAGMGKTTLARLVYEAIQGQFQTRAFVSVTASRNMTELLLRILQQVTADDSSDVVLLAGTKASTKNKNLIDVISSFLKDKKYLIIIDDILHWGEWETIKKSLPDNNLGSRIVTTSRAIAITEKWHEDFDAFVYKICHRPSSWSGYGPDPTTTKMIDMNADMIGEGFDRGHRIVVMCHGMPLTAACMISALAKERERQEQQQGPQYVVRARDVQDQLEEQVKRNGIQKTPGFEPLVQSLELGYNHLPHHMLKTCLLYCSIYPEGHDFKRDDLIRRWIAEGFVCKEEAAEDYFDELVSMGFIGEFSSLSGETVYRMHPMMRNYLRRKLEQDNFITCTSDSDISSAPIGRLCIDSRPSSDSLDPLSGIDSHCIRSLVVFEDAKRVPYKHLEHLRVLDIQQQLLGSASLHLQALENQHVKDMCGLHRLRHLFVSGGLGEAIMLGFHDRLGRCVTEIPTEVARLQYLETLHVTETMITRLPVGIGDLKQLKTLGVSWNIELVELPREMGNLQQLETLGLSRTRIGQQAWEIIGKLKTLDVSHNPEISGIPRDIGELQQLRTLNLSATSIAEVPHEIGNLQNLEALDLSFAKVRKIPREIGGLKKLKNLNTHFVTIPFEAVLLSKQEGVPKWVHQALKNTHLMSSLAGEMLSFSRIGSDGDLIVGRKHMHIPKWIKEHFNNITCLNIRICKLEEQDLKILREMPCLEMLTLRLETVPRKPIVISNGGFTKLGFLTVDSRVPRIRFQEGAMPSLHRLTFEFQFYGGPPNTDPLGINHLVYLERVIFQCNEWYRVDSPCISATIDVIRKEAREHRKRITLIVPGQEFEIFPENNRITQSSQDRNEACRSNGAQEIKEIQD